MNKRGVEVPAAFAVGAIILLITLGILVYWLGVAGVILQKENDDSVCKLTLKVQSATHLTDYGDSPFKIDCERTFIDVTPTKAVSTKGKDVTLLTYSRPTDEALGQFFASRLAHCWELGLEGKESVFNDQGVWGTRSTICMVCDQVDVQLEGEYLKQQTLSAYLATHKMPGLDITYEQYLFSPKQISEKITDGTRIVTSGERSCLTQNGVNLDPTVTAGTYAVVFLRDFGKFRGSCTGTYVVPGEQLRTLCDYAAN